MAVSDPSVNYSWDVPNHGGDVGAWGNMLRTIIADTVTGIDAILKAVSDVANAALARAGGTMTGALTMLTERLTAVNLGGALSGAVTVNMALANVFHGTMTSSVTLSFSNVPATGLCPFIVIKLVNTNGDSITWPASVRWPNDTAPSSFTNGLAQVFVLFTHDGGTKWFAQHVPEYVA
jgi:hypothetical protein